MKKIGLLCSIQTAFVVAFLLVATWPVGGYSQLTPETDPALTLQVGAVSTDNPAGLLTVPLPDSAAFDSPGESPSWSGLINSSSLISTPITGSVGMVDGLDRVTFAIVIQNSGGGNVKLSDIHLQGVASSDYITPTGGESLNIQGRTGAGDELLVEQKDGGLFGDGILINHVDTNESVLGGFSPSSGENVAVVTFDLTIKESVAPSISLPISIRIVGYSFTEDGENIVAEFPLNNIRAETAALITTPRISSTVINTTQLHNTTAYTDVTPVTIGEIITYEVQLMVPEGTSQEGFLKSEMDQGFALVDVLSVEATPNVTTTVSGGFEGVRKTVRLIELSNPGPNMGQKFDLYFGALTVASHGENQGGMIKMRYRAISLNNDKNSQGDEPLLRNQYLQWCWGEEHHIVTGNTPDSIIVEPELALQQTISPTESVPGDVVTVTLSIDHTANSGASAHEVVLADLLPLGLQYQAGTLAWSGQGVEPTSLAALTETLFLAADDTATVAMEHMKMEVGWNTLPAGASSSVQLRAILNYDYLPPSLESQTVSVVNEAKLTWSSLPGLQNQALSIYHDLAAERTGDTTNVGEGFNTYITTSQRTLHMDVPATPPDQARVNVDLSVENLTRQDGPVQPSDHLRYTLTIQNIGASPAIGVHLSNRIERNLNLIANSIYIGQGSLSQPAVDGSSIIEAHIGTVAPSEVVTAAYDVLVAEQLKLGTEQVVNQALIHGNNFALAISNDPATIEMDDPTVLFTSGGPRLVVFSHAELVDDVDNDQMVSSGDILKFDVEILNRGHSDAEEVVFYNRFGETMGLVAESINVVSGTIVSGTQPGQSTLEINFGNLAASETASVAFQATVNPLGLNTQLIESQSVVVGTNHPAVLSDDPSTLTLGDPTTIALNASPVILATKTHHLLNDNDDNGYPSPGDQLAYRVILRNRGNISATDIIFTDLIEVTSSLVISSVQANRSDASFTVQDGSPLNEAVIQGAGDNIVEAQSDLRSPSLLTVNLPSLDESGAFDKDTIYMSYLVNVSAPISETTNADAGARIRNQGVIVSNELAPQLTHDPLRAIPNTSTDTLIDRLPYVEMLKRDLLLLDLNGDGLLSPSEDDGERERLLYQIRVSNLGNTPATSVILEDKPDSLTRLVPESVRTNRGDIVVGNSADSTSVLVELGPMAEQQVVGAAEEAIISFEVELKPNQRPLQVENIANVLVTIDNPETELDGQYSLPSDDPDTLPFGDATITSVSQAPTSIDETQEPEQLDSRPLLYLPLVTTH